MTPRSICTRTATIALTAAALLAAPAASAQPIDMAPVHVETGVRASDSQDLRSADAIDAATRTTADPQDLRSAGAIDAATRTAPELQANAQADTPKASAERGIAWTTIAIAGSLLALGVIAAIASRTRRTARARISA